MTREEQAIVYFKDMRKRMCEDHLKICPKDSVAYRATLIEKGFYDAAIKALEQEPKKGHWIETAKEYYKAINEKGGGVNENTDYFTDDIACSECLAKFSVVDNEAERFDFCPCCGSNNQ